MKITQNFDSPLTSTQAVNDIDSQKISNDKKLNSQPTVNSATDEVSISSQGMSHQKIDSLFNQADAIYQSHITPKQQKFLDESYAKLDELFNKSSPSELEQKNADGLFDKIDLVFEQAEKQLTPSEKDQLAVINTKLDELLGSQDMQLDDNFSEEVDKLFQQSEDLLTSKLSTEQKKTLDGLNKQLNALFEKSNVDDEGVEGIFDKIDNILNQGYDKLSNDEKNKLDDYDSEIDKLFNQFDPKDSDINYP
jgi:tRNA C32,U32 (ribose-2'-O)-methylase TrmJ